MLPAIGQAFSLLHSNTLERTSDDHHAQSHAHNGGDGSGTVAHSSTSGKTANDHHNQSHDVSDHSDMEIIIKAADQSVTNNSTPQDDNDFSFSIAANENLTLRLVLRASGGAAENLVMQWSGPSGVNGIAIYINSEAGTIGADTQVLTGNTTAVTTTATTIIYEAVIFNGATAGTMTFQFALQDGTGTVTVHEGSSLAVIRG